MKGEGNVPPTPPLGRVDMNVLPTPTRAQQILGMLTRDVNNIVNRDMTHTSKKLCASQAFQRLINTTPKKGDALTRPRRPVREGDVVKSEEAVESDIFERTNIQELLSHPALNLSRKAQAVMIHRYLENMTLEETAQAPDIQTSPSRVQQIEAKVLRLMRHPARRELVSALGPIWMSQQTWSEGLDARLERTGL